MRIVAIDDPSTVPGCGGLDGGAAAREDESDYWRGRDSGRPA